MTPFLKNDPFFEKMTLYLKNDPFFEKMTLYLKNDHQCSKSVDLSRGTARDKFSKSRDPEI